MGLSSFYGMLQGTINIIGQVKPLCQLGALLSSVSRFTGFVFSWQLVELALWIFCGDSNKKKADRKALALRKRKNDACSRSNLLSAYRFASHDFCLDQRRLLLL